VRVPEDAADGKVQVKVSFPALKAFPVTGTTSEFRIETQAADEPPPGAPPAR
jgi:hypothetical protein